MGRVAAGYDMIGTVPTTASIAVGAILVGVQPFQVILGITAVGCVAAALSMLPARGSLLQRCRASRHVPGWAWTPAIPARISTPPTAWMGVGIWPAAGRRRSTAKITSDRATKEAIELPSRRTASMPVR